MNLDIATFISPHRMSGYVNHVTKYFNFDNTVFLFYSQYKPCGGEPGTFA